MVAASTARGRGARSRARWPHRTRAELTDAIFAPGFSTTRTVTEVWGVALGCPPLEACPRAGRQMRN